MPARVEVKLALEFELGGAVHQDVIVSLAPFDEQRAAGKLNADAPARAPGAGSSYGRGASRCAAGARDACAALPYAQLDAELPLILSFSREGRRDP